MLPVCVQSIHVDDLARAEAFYTTALGYEVKERYGPCITELRTHGATTLILEQLQPGSGPQMPGTVLCFETKDIEAAMREVEAAGGQLVDRTPQPCPVGRAALFKDPAGVVQTLLQFER